MSVETFRFAPLEPVAAPPAAPGTVPLPYGAGSTAFAGAPGGTVPAVPGGTVPAVAAVDVEALVAEARAEGYAEGAADARGTIEPAVAALHGVAAELAGLRERIAEQTERAAVDLAMKIAEQVVRSAIDADRERIVDVVRGGLRRLVERERVIVLVNPEDLDTVREHMTLVVAELGGVEHYEVQADRRVSRGGAVVRTAEGEVDATIESKLERVREVLDGELSN
jgi:flagellar assembly protein FliH